MSETPVVNSSLEIGSRLAELCRAHRIPEQWIASSRDLDQLLGLVLDDCGRRIADHAGGAG